MRHLPLFFYSVCLLACDPAAKMPGGVAVPQPVVDMASSTSIESPCPPGAKTAMWQDCQQHCVPAEQVWFICTSGNYGRLAYTRAELLVQQKYAYAIEINDLHCKTGYPVSVWRLEVPETRPTDVTVGMMSYDTMYSDCSTEPLHPAYIDQLGTDKEVYYGLTQVLPAQVM